MEVFSSIPLLLCIQIVFFWSEDVSADIPFLNENEVDRLYSFDEKPVAEGYCGKVYLGFIKATKKRVALKLEIKKPRDAIAVETKIFEDLKKFNGTTNLLDHGFPDLLNTCTYQDLKGMIMTALGKDVASIVKSRSGLNNFKILCNVAKNMIRALKFLHNVGYVHKDVKIENMASGLEDAPTKERDVSLKKRYYLFDFGNTERYRYENGTNIERKTDTRGGIPVVNSRTAMLCLSQTPRDDMEALMYTLMRVVGALPPWTFESNLTKLNAKKDLFLRLNMEATLQRMGITNKRILMALSCYLEALAELFPKENEKDDDAYIFKQPNYDRLERCFDETN